MLQQDGGGLGVLSEGATGQQEDESRHEYEEKL